MSYQKCIEAKSGKKGLCPRGYCTAKQIFKVYPSAYANGYAASVCKGKKADFMGNTYQEKGNTKKIKGIDNPLQRWFKETWVNVCKKGESAGGYAPCGSNNDSKRYPYCRPYYKLPGTTVKTVKDLSKAEMKHMCEIKHSSDRVFLGENIRKSKTGSSSKK